MGRLFLLGLLVLLFSGCAATAQEGSPPPTATSQAQQAAGTEPVRLAATWQQANQSGAEATGLLYFAPNVPGGPPPYALWRMPLDGSGKPQIRAYGPANISGISGARLSADEEWVAYGARLGDWPYDLHVMRVDGSEDQILVQTGNPSDCTPKYAWSHTGATLVYPYHGGFIIRSYDAPTGTTREVPGPGSAFLLGVDGQGRALMTPHPDGDEPRDIIAVDPETGAATTLGTMPSAERLYCRRVSPDGNHLLFNLNRTAYHFGVATRQFTPVEGPLLRAFWSSDYNALLTFSGDADNVVSVVPFTPTTGIAGAATFSRVLEPPTRSPGRFSVLSTSPDGRWLVGCHIVSNREIFSYLYNLERDTWHLLSEGGRCARVAGWTTQ